MKKTLRMMALLMVLTLALGTLAACGGKSDAPADKNAPAGNEDSKDIAGGDPENGVKGVHEVHGLYRVIVPDGFTLTPGDAFGDTTNPKAFTLSTGDGTYTYYQFNMFSESNARSSIETTKEFNDGAKDVTVVYNGVTWEGVAYDSGDIPCFSMIADYGTDHFVIVSAAGNAYDSNITEAVLSSLLVNVPTE